MSTIPKTLFIRGVFIKDLVTLENLFNDENSYYSTNTFSNLSVENDYEQYESEYITFDKFPKIFINMEKWPHKTNIKCMYCSLDILGIPIPISESMDKDKDYNQIFDISVICCSFSCGASLITHTINNKSLRHGMLGMLKIIRKIFYNNGYFDSLYNNNNIASNISEVEVINNIINNELQLSPIKKELCHYGGNMSIKEFRDNIRKIEIGKFL